MKNEIEIARSVHHPALITIIDVEDDGLRFVMEFFPDGPLANSLGPISRKTFSGHFGRFARLSMQWGCCIGRESFTATSSPTRSSYVLAKASFSATLVLRSSWMAESG